MAPERGAEIIESIKRLDYPRSEFHVVIVKGRNPSDNRNKGAERGVGDYIVFLDDDGVIEADYLINVERFFERYSYIDVVGGPQLTPKDEEGFALVSGYALSSWFGAWKISNRYLGSGERLDVDETFVTSSNLICRKEVMEKVKFDPGLFPGEDPKFISDAKKEGFRIAYSPDIVIYHRRRANIGGLIKQIFNYGRVRPLKEGFFETMKMPFFFIPSLFLIYLFFLSVIVILNPSITGSVINFNGVWNFQNLGFWLFVPLFLYIFLVIVFSIYDALRNKDIKAIFLLPLMYLLIHLSYGAGMIWGYLKK